jgi:hypothetical protein
LFCHRCGAVEAQAAFLLSVAFVPADYQFPNDMPNNGKAAENKQEQEQNTKYPGRQFCPVPVAAAFHFMFEKHMVTVK